MNNNITVLKAEEINTSAVNISNIRSKRKLPPEKTPDISVKPNDSERKILNTKEDNDLNNTVIKKSDVIKMPVNKHLTNDMIIDKIDAGPHSISKNTFQESICKGIGHYVICEFLIGADQINVREGVLREVGQNYFILYNEKTDTSITCDFYSLKFITFYRAGVRPHNGI